MTLVTLTGRGSARDPAFPRDPSPSRLLMEVAELPAVRFFVGVLPDVAYEATGFSGGERVMHTDRP